MEPFINAATSTSAPGAALIALLLLIALLIQKEIAGSLTAERARQLSLAINIALAPLLIACAGIVVLRIAATLR
jgi:hypothetical protein